MINFVNRINELFSNIIIFIYSNFYIFLHDSNFDVDRTGVTGQTAVLTVEPALHSSDF